MELKDGKYYSTVQNTWNILMGDNEFDLFLEPNIAYPGAIGLYKNLPVYTNV